jgi:N utilization substance protein B
MGQRRRARELAFLSIYQCEVLGGLAARCLADLLADQSRPPEVAEFAGLVVESFDRHRAAVDRVIRETSPKWELERMASTDRAVLRLAVTELLLIPGVPEPVTINEAVDIAKRYGGDESGHFVNGVLDAIRLRLEAGETEIEFEIEADALATEADAPATETDAARGAPGEG